MVKIANLISKLNFYKLIFFFFFYFIFFFFALIYFIYPFAIKKKESREGEGSKPSIETMYSNFYIKILLYIYIVSI